MWGGRERQLKDAARLLARVGLGATVVTELAAEMRQSVGGLYSDYGSKLEVARQVVAFADHLLWQQMSDAELQPGTSDALAQVLQRTWHAALVFADAEADLFAYAHLHWRHPLGSEARVDAHVGRSRGYLQALLASAMAEGTLRSQPVEVAFAMFWGPLLQWVKHRRDGGGEAEATQVFAMIWVALAA